QNGLKHQYFKRRFMSRNRPPSGDQPQYASASFSPSILQRRITSYFAFGTSRRRRRKTRVGGQSRPKGWRCRLDIEKAIVAFGTEAVLQYRTMATPRHDNEVPESFIRSFVALRLHERLGCQAHVERLYTATALDLGAPLSVDLVTV